MACHMRTRLLKIRMILRYVFFGMGADQLREVQDSSWLPVLDRRFDLIEEVRARLVLAHIEGNEHAKDCMFVA